jgi:tetratricopeptide (TPR) repeat protein
VEDRDRASRPDACPSDETLAAWIDGMVAPAEADQVEAHVVACNACAELLAALGGALGEVQVVPADVPREAAVRRGVFEWVGWRLIAVAAAVVLAVAGGAVWHARSDAETADALRMLSAAQGRVRPTYGRLHGFDWAAPPPTLRAGSTGTVNASAALLNAASDIERRYEGSESPETRHVRGVALLLGGDVDAAIGLLDTAVGARPSDARFVNDAAVAHLQRAWATSDAASIREARRLAEAAVGLQSDSPDGWFNLMSAARLGGDKAREEQAVAALRRLEPAASRWRNEIPIP